MGLGPVFAVFETLRRNNPGFALQVDLSPSGADYLARPEPRQQCDFEGSGGDALSLAYCGKALRRLRVIKGSLPATS